MFPQGGTTKEWYNPTSAEFVWPSLEFMELPYLRQKKVLQYFVERSKNNEELGRKNFMAAVNVPANSFLSDVFPAHYRVEPLPSSRHGDGSLQSLVLAGH